MPALLLFCVFKIFTNLSFYIRETSVYIMACHFDEYQGMFPIFSIKMQMEHEVFVHVVLKFFSWKCMHSLRQLWETKVKQLNIKGIHLLVCELHIKTCMKRINKLFSIDIYTIVYICIVYTYSIYTILFSIPSQFFLLFSIPSLNPCFLPTTLILGSLLPNFHTLFFAPRTSVSMSWSWLKKKNTNTTYSEIMIRKIPKKKKKEGESNTKRVTRKCPWCPWLFLNERPCNVILLSNGRQAQRN